MRNILIIGILFFCLTTVNAQTSSVATGEDYKLSAVSCKVMYTTCVIELEVSAPNGKYLDINTSKVMIYDDVMNRYPQSVIKLYLQKSSNDVSGYGPNTAMLFKSGDKKNSYLQISSAEKCFSVGNGDRIMIKITDRAVQMPSTIKKIVFHMYGNSQKQCEKLSIKDLSIHSWRK